jgi:hypothetical protein
MGILVPPPVPDPHLARADTPPAYTLYSTHPKHIHRKAPPCLSKPKTPGVYIFSKKVLRTFVFAFKLHVSKRQLI